MDENGNENGNYKNIRKIINKKEEEEKGKIKLPNIVYGRLKRKRRKRRSKKEQMGKKMEMI